MKRLLDMITMTAGSYLGWMISAYISIFTAFIVSMVGMGLGLYLGLYLGRRFTKGILP